MHRGGCTVSLRNLGGFGRDQIRQGGGRGNGNDHLDELIGSTELFIYQTPNRKSKGFDALKLFLEANECEVLFTTTCRRNFATTRHSASHTSAASRSPHLSCAVPTRGPTAATSCTASSSHCTGRAASDQLLSSSRPYEFAPSASDPVPGRRGGRAKSTSTVARPPITVKAMKASW